MMRYEHSVGNGDGVNERSRIAILMRAASIIC